ncbi:MAG: molybdopterin-dependent oxidoreductase [Ignisphaera sp.]
MTKEVLISCPRDCYDTCMLRVYVEGSSIVRITANDDKYTQGILCPRAVNDIKRIYSPLRILYPSFNIGGSIFRKIDWDKALEMLTSNLKEILDIYGSEKVLFLEYAGNRGILTRYASRRIWNFIGATQTDRSICNYSGSKALRFVYGSTYGVFPDDIERLNMVIVWGFNPAVSAIHLWKKILEVKDRGGKIITIDVRLTETAKQSTNFIKVKPGSDGYLALGIAKYLLDKGYVNLDFIDKYTYGFDKLVKHLENYRLDIVEMISGVSRINIIEIAEAIASSRNFAIFIGYGLQRRYGGGEIVRSIAILPALLGIHRGFYYSNTDGLQINLALVDGSERWNSGKVVSMERIGEELARGEYKFVYIHLHNPAATLPNASKVIEGLKRDDVFVVVHETHWSDTARYADLVLPAPTFYEKLDVVFSYLHNVVHLNEPAIDPLGEAVGEYQLMCEITKKILLHNYDELCLDPYKIFELALGKENTEKLFNKGYVKLKPRPKDVYQTPSGRIELYSILAKKEGLSPLPTPLKGDPLEENELLLITSAHPSYIHTQFEDVYGVNYGEIHISSEDAQKLSLATGDIIEVYNEKGSAILKVKVDLNLSKGVAWLPRQTYTYDGKRINVILNDGVDIYGGATLNSTRIRIKPLRTHKTNY